MPVCLLEGSVCSIVVLQVKHLRSHYPGLDIEVDGGVGLSTIETAAEVSLSLSLSSIASSYKIIPFFCRLELT